MQHEPTVRLHRPAEEYRRRLTDIGAALEIELIEDIAEVEVHRAIDGDPQRALFVMLANISHAVVKVGVSHCRHRNQEVIV